jgi:tetratricopeptide (TPR) repeat protein
MRASIIEIGRFLLFAAVCSVMGTVLWAQTPGRQPVSSLMQDAAKEISTGKLDQAEKALESLLRSTPGDYRALDLLGVVRVLQHQETKGEELFSQVVKTKPDFAPGHAHLGLLHLQLGRTQDAVFELRQALLIDPDRTDVARALGHILQDQAQTASASGDWDNALALLKEARKYGPDNADVQFEFGMAALKLALQEDAIEAFQQTLKLRNNDALTLYNLGRAFMELSKFDDARQQFAHYVEIRPDDPSGHCALGMTLAALERSEEARAQFERSIALAPAQTESYYRLGLLDLNSRDYDAATQDLRHVLDHEPNDAAALTALGKVEFGQKHYSEAVSLLQQAISSADSLPEAHYYLGLTLARMGRKMESNEQLEIATRLEHEQNQSRRSVLRILEPGGADKARSLSPK